MNEDFLRAIAEFADVKTRLDAAGKLAKLMHAHDICCFHFDPVVNSFLPAPGFKQTISNAKEWQRFLKAGKNQDNYEGKITLSQIEWDAISIASKNDCVLILIGYQDNDIPFKQLQEIFPLISSLIRSEVLNGELVSRLQTAVQSSRKSEQLTKYLDNVRTKLQQALKTEEEFISVASHELKTPVTSINGFIQILQQNYSMASPDDRTNYILSRIKFQVDRLIRLIGDLLDVTKIKFGKLDLVIEEVDLDKIIDEQIQDYASNITSHKITRTGNSVSKIQCDKHRIEQVISNLLANAIKYSLTSDRIVIFLEEDLEKVQVNIQDFGIGIESASKSKIFDRFFRAHGKDSGRLSSLGLGLFICADIIKRHNGKIWVDSELGKGSTFHFSLPK